MRTRRPGLGDGDEPRAYDPDILAEAADHLRVIVAALPPTTARDRATARRIQGAAAALETLARTRAADSR